MNLSNLQRDNVVMLSNTIFERAERFKEKATVVVVVVVVVEVVVVLWWHLSPNTDSWPISSSSSRVTQHSLKSVLCA